MCQIQSILGVKTVYLIAMYNLVFKKNSFAVYLKTYRAKKLMLYFFFELCCTCKLGTIVYIYLEVECSTNTGPSFGYAFIA